MQLQLITELEAPSIYLHAIIASYGGVAIAMAADFVAGIRRARRSGNATRSRSYKMTCTKARKYFLPMVCLTSIDLLGLPLLPFPVFSMAMGAFNIFCEWKSVMESTHDKEEIRKAASTMRLIIENKEEIARTLVRIMNEPAGESRKEE